MYLLCVQREMLIKCQFERMITLWMTAKETAFVLCSDEYVRFDIMSYVPITVRGHR